MNPEEFENEYGLEKLQIITPEKRNFRVAVIHKYVDHYTQNLYEHFTEDLLLSLLRNGDLFVDIGAHFGFYTLLVGTSYENNKIIAFEPVPENYEILKKNTELNNLKNVDVYNLAVSNKNDTRKFNVAEHSCSSGFDHNPVSKTIKTIDVEAVAIDSFLNNCDVPIVMKIDTEGHEIDVIEGMKDILKNNKDVKLFIEFNPKCLKSAGYEPEDLLKKINMLGFDIYVIEDEKREIYKLTENNSNDWNSYIDKGNYGRTYFNILCVKKEILDSDERTKDLGYDRHTTEIARSKLVSHLIEGNNVLEVGCDDMYDPVEMAKNDLDVVGIDMSSVNIKKVTKLAGKEGVQTKTKFFVMDGTMLSLPDGSFDSVVISEFFRNVRSPRKLLDEAVRVVRNGGRIIVSAHDELLTSWEDYRTVSTKNILMTELGKYSTEVEFHDLQFKRWVICSFFVKKKKFDIREGPLVDIMMPTFNGRKTIEKAIRSVINQTYQNWNLVVVNDGGEDIHDIIKEFNDDRIKYICTSNKGKSHALNIGIANSNGEYVTYLDDDDILYPIHVEVLAKTALEKKQDFVYSDWYEISVDENYKEFRREIEFRLDVTPAMLIFQNYINHKCVFHKRSLLETIGMYDEDLSILIDWDMIRRLAFVSKPYHVWSFTSERIRYYSGDILQNKITSLSIRDPAKAHKSIENIVKKTVDLHASQSELEDAVIEAMLSMGYYHSFRLNSSLQAKDVQISDLNSSLQAKDVQISDLNSSLQAKDVQISDLNSSLQAKDVQIKNIEASLKEKNIHVEELDNIVRTRDKQILDLENQISSMKNSIVWQLLMRYHYGVVEQVLPNNTGRRRIYDLGLLSLQVIKNEGLKTFLKKLKNKIFPTKIMIDELSVSSKNIRSDNVVVDIVLPVYNAFDDMKRCIESVLSLTSTVEYRLIIIDDKSTDQRIGCYLDYLKQKNFSNVFVLYNSNNMGFVKTVNKGIRFSKNDIVLLNSDTIVSYRWLEKLMECAHVDEKIATATPLSNNATICSVPDFCQYNDIPKGYSIQEFSLLIENVSKDLNKKCIRIPVGVGFCLYIKRTAINDVGMFDESFGRGYNEENDFCMRSYNKGYYHVVDLSTFVYHKGKASFMSDQTMLEKINSKLLSDRYPHYMELVHDFCERNPLQDVQSNIRNKINRRIDLPVTIGIDAQLLARSRWTGTERYISVVLESLLCADHNNVYLAYTSTNVIDSFCSKNNKFTKRYAADSKDILLDSESLDIFHRTFQCFSIYDILTLLKARCSVITLHDLILYHFSSYFNSATDASQYKRYMELSAKFADRIIAISEHNKKDIIQNLNVPETKIDVIYHGIDLVKFKKIYDDDILREFRNKYGMNREYILYVGTDFPHKNHKNLILAYKKLIEKMDDIDLILVGPSTSKEREKEIRTLVRDTKDRIKILNYIDDEDVVYLYNCARLFAYPSLYEGFGLPLLEAMACGVPIVASNETSIPEIVGDAGILVDGRNVDKLYRSMFDVLSNEDLRKLLIERGFERVKEFSWNKTAIKTIETYKKTIEFSKDRNLKRLTDDDIEELEDMLHNMEGNKFILDCINNILKSHGNDMSNIYPE
jgi:FkbM family methyltransferase